MLGTAVFGLTISRGIVGSKGCCAIGEDGFSGDSRVRSKGISREQEPEYMPTRDASFSYADAEADLI